MTIAIYTTPNGRAPFLTWRDGLDTKARAIIKTRLDRLMVRKMIDYREELINSLEDPKEAIAYLNAALHDDDPRLILIAIRNVYEAQGGDMTSLEKEAKSINENNLYHVLSTRGAPKLASIKSVLENMGLELQIKPTKNI